MLINIPYIDIKYDCIACEINVLSIVLHLLVPVQYSYRITSYSGIRNTIVRIVYDASMLCERARYVYTRHLLNDLILYKLNLNTKY